MKYNIGDIFVAGDSELGYIESWIHYYYKIRWMNKENNITETIATINTINEINEKILKKYWKYYPVKK